jgi:fructose-bisphosphate aldolase class II
MLEAARSGGYAFPAINVSSSETLNAALAGFAEAESDGIIQVSTSGGQFLSGTKVNDMAVGAQALAEFAHHVAARYPTSIALHTDHCQPDRVDGFIRPLLAESARRRANGLGPLFQSHMLDASALPLDENLALAAQLLEECSSQEVLLELEIGIVGGVEDTMDHTNVDRRKLYTTPEDMMEVVERLGVGEKGHYLLAAVFGNVHGVYKPGSVELRPSILREGQQATHQRFGYRHYLVFHGGSGSTLEEIRETVGYGVVKMNIDTDTQYALTRSVADHMFTNYAGVMKVDGEVGNKKVYDPRSYMKKAQGAMAGRVVQACLDLGSAGQSING